MAIDPERRSRIRTALNEEGLDAFICATPTGVLLLSGYWPVLAISAAVFTAEGEIHILAPEDEREIAAHSSDAALTVFKPFSLDALTSPGAAIQAPLISLCKQLSLESARVGLELEQGIQPASYAAMASFHSTFPGILSGAFPHLRIAAAGEFLERLKASKTPVELEKMRAAAAIAETGFAGMTAAITSGRREAEIASQLQAAFDKAPAASQMQRSYGYFFCMSGPNSAAAAASYARTRQRIVEKGDLTMIHANTCADGYWTDITRTATAGEPSKKQSEMRQAVMEASAAALDAIRPGLPAREADRVARTVLDKRGYGPQFKHALGHGVGFAAANPDGRPRIHPASPDILEAGMTFNVEPAIYFEGYGGIRHCDIVAVTANGVEVLTPF